MNMAARVNVRDALACCEWGWLWTPSILLPTSCFVRIVGLSIPSPALLTS